MKILKKAGQGFDAVTASGKVGALLAPAFPLAVVLAFQAQYFLGHFICGGDGL